MEDNGEKEDEEIVIRCPSCGVQNKLKTVRLEQGPRCGRCGAVLIEMREFGSSE
jgi:uncharacterized paraquat-inducible protein A